MKQKIFDLCRRVWAGLAGSFDEYNKMKKQQVMKIVKADEAGNHEEALINAEEL